MAGHTVYSTPPSNAAWFRKLASGDAVKALASYQMARAAVEKMREAESVALNGDGTVKGDGKISAQELEVIKRAGQTAGEQALKSVSLVAKTHTGNFLNKVTGGSNEGLVTAAIQNELRNISVRDAFEPAALKKLRAMEDVQPRSITDSAGVGDARYDGAVLGANNSIQSGDIEPGAVPKFRPANGVIRSKDVFIHVNGINTFKDQQVKTLQSVADRVGGEVFGVHNATKGASDIMECVNDKINPTTNRAVHTLSTLAFKTLKEGKTPHLMAHSQGGIITRRALMELYHRIADDLRPTISDPIALHQAALAQMGKVKVETFGAAAHEYPDGPQYVHYVNTWDLVPSEMGLGWGETKNENSWMIRPGKGAKMLYLRDGAVDSELNVKGYDLKFLGKVLNRMNGSTTHNFDTIYLPARLDWDEARALENPVSE